MKLRNKMTKNKSNQTPSLLRRVSLRKRLLFSFSTIIIVMVSINLLIVINFNNYSVQYNNIITNITRANSVNGVFQKDIDYEMYFIVSGTKKFKEADQYQIISKFENTIHQIIDSTQDPARLLDLDIILRTLGSLNKYVDEIGVQIATKKTVEEQMKTLDQVRSISSLINREIQDYIMYEVNTCGEINAQLQKSIKNWLLFNVITLGCLIIVSFIVAWYISGSVSNPVKNLRKMTKIVSTGNFDERIVDVNSDEIADLGYSFNIMTVKIKELMDERIEKQKKLKNAEFKVLQAQINPHFLYNTLDTIVWMAEAGHNDKVILLVRELSNFFRKSISKGRDIITVQEEVGHVSSYLSILKVRYRDTLDYSIQVMDSILGFNIPKFTLQPLVENALYHGIKNKRGNGKIIVSGSRINEQEMMFEVIDNGIGMDDEKLRAVIRALDMDHEENSDINSFGMSNVHQRIRLYYGNNYGLKIKSTINVGTEVSVTVPIEII
ncbi:MAG: histidine kinase internal region [Eubacterium sp.]|nr:histidine kinase internal region [Eubacterium sp.]